MGVERSGFQIDMTVDATGVVAGNKQAGDAFDGTKQKVADLNTALGEGKGKLDDAGKSGEEAGEGLKRLGIGGHDAHAALHGLGEAMPGVQHLGRYLANDFTLSLGLALVAFQYMKGQIEEFDQALDKLGTGPGARAEWLDRMKEKLEESAVAFNVWEAHIAKVLSAEQTLSQLADRSLAVDKEKLTTGNAITQAQKDLAEARLQLAVKLGQVTPSQAIKIRLEIDDAAMKAQMEVKQKEIEAEKTALLAARSADLKRRCQSSSLRQLGSW
jgi:hypothetical protein